MAVFSYAKAATILSLPIDKPTPHLLCLVIQKSTSISHAKSAAILESHHLHKTHKGGAPGIFWLNLTLTSGWAAAHDAASYSDLSTMRLLWAR